MIDLHAHSTASDGAFTPAELVALAHAEGLSAIALTDHDTVAGLDEASAEAARRGIRFVPGIELEVDWQTGIFHLLGLGLRTWHGPARRRLEHAQHQRKTRNLAIIARMQLAGVPIRYEELREIAGHDTVGRPHFARWLVQHGVVRTEQEAFDTMIGDRGAFFERRVAPGVGACCATVHAAGGKAIVAHPQTLRLEFEELETCLKRWRGEGLDGIEAYHTGTSCDEGHRIAALAQELGLLVTAGSDFHKSNGARLGRCCEGRPIDDAFMRKLLD